MIALILWVMTVCVCVAISGVTVGSLMLAWDHADERMRARRELQGEVDEIERKALRSAHEEGERMRLAVDDVLGH